MVLNSSLKKGLIALAWSQVIVSMAWAAIISDQSHMTVNTVDQG